LEEEGESDEEKKVWECRGYVGNSIVSWGRTEERRREATEGLWVS